MKSTTKAGKSDPDEKKQGSLMNKKAPSFSLKNSQGEKVTLSELKGQKIVLYFYPKDDTPGCTLEGNEFSKYVKKFKDHNTVIFGVSKDSVESHDKFKCKYNFGFELLSDENEVLCNKFDVIKEKNMYGKKYMGIERSTFIIDEDQKIIAEYRKVKPEGHAEEILAFIKSHS